MKAIKNIIVAIAFALCTMVLILNIMYMTTVSNGWEEKVSIYPLGIIDFAVTSLIVIGIISASNWLDKYLEGKNLKKIIKIGIIIILFLIYVVSQIGWIFIRKYYPIADSMQVYNAACEMDNKEAISAIKYFELYPQNLTLAYMFSKIFWIVGSSNLMVIEFVNIIANCFTIVGLYCITNILKEKYPISKTRFVWISFTYFPIMLLVNFIYGDIVSLPLVIFSVYFAMKYVKTKQNRWLGISAILMMIAVILRMNNLIFIIAISIYFAFHMLDIKNTLQIGIKILGIVIFIVISILPSSFLKNVLINRYGLEKEKSFPITGFIAIGMQEGMRQNGWYNNTADIAWQEIETANKQYKEIINQRINEFSHHIFYTIKFYVKKVASMWTEPLQESIWQNLSFNFEETKLKEKTQEEIEEYKKIDQKLINHQEILGLYQKALILIIFAVAVVTMIKNRKNISDEMILLLVCFVGGFMFHILWEAKSRYIIPYIIVLIPIASIKCNKK